MPSQAPHTVKAVLNHYLPPSKGGQAVYYPGTASDKRREHDPREVVITDIRGREEDFKLDVQGFQMAQQESKEKVFDDDARIREVYYPECEELVKEL